MKRKLLNCFIAAAMMFTASITASAETVTISSQAEFEKFVTRVNDGETTLDAELTTDVTSTTGQYIGTSDNKYKGKFNGMGNTITVSYNETTADRVSLIRYAEAATICNLTVNGTISTVSGSGDEGKYSAAFIGEAFGDNTVENCVSNVAFTFDASSKSDATYGAIIGLNQGSAMIKNCAVLGSVNSANESSVEGIGGFVGWSNGGSSATTIINSYSKQTYSGLRNDNPGNNFSRNGATISNSYYLNAVGTDNQGEQKTADEFTNGTVAGLLGSMWVQDGEDIVLNSKGIDLVNCASGAMTEDGNNYEITLTVPSKYIDGTDIDATYDFYVGVYDNDGVEVVAPVVKTKGETVTYTLDANRIVGKYTLKLTLKDNDNSIIGEDEIVVNYDNSFKLNNEAQSYSMDEGEYLTVYDNGGSTGNYTCSAMENGSFTVSAAENTIFTISGSYWLVVYHNIDLIFTKDGISRTVTLEGNWNGNNINEINSKLGEELTIKFRCTGFSSSSRGGFNINIKAKAAENCTVTLNANGGTGEDIPLSLIKDNANILPTNTFTRENYSFIGWATSADGEVEYANGAEITPANDMTLYALWERGIIMHSGSITITEELPFYDSGAKNNYSDNEDYTLTVNAPAGKLVQVNFAKFNVYSYFDYLEIYNGTSTEATLIAKLDADFYTTKTYTATNADGALTFRFISNESHSETGWEAALTVVDLPTEYILSFNNDKGDNPADITAYDGLAINKTLPSVADVNDNIFVGWTIDDVRITPETVYNYGSDKTASAIWEKGYRMKDDNITLAEGENYAFYDSGTKFGNYSNNENYTLTVNAPEGKLVQVDFTEFDVFDNSDYLEIYNGSSTEATLIAKLDANFSTTKTYISTSTDGALTFKFTSSILNNATGWEASLTTIDKPTEYTISFNNEKGDAPADITVYDGLPINNISNLADIDGYIFSGWEIDGTPITAETVWSFTEDKTAIAVWEQGFVMKAGEITLEAGENYKFYDSGSKYGNYSDNEDCTLTVNAPEGKLVQVHFSSYNIEGRDFDYLKIYNGSSAEDGNLYATLEDKDITNANINFNATEANGGALTFKFVSDRSGNYSGWEATLSTIDKPAKYTLSFNNDKGDNPEDISVYDGLIINTKLPKLEDADDCPFLGWRVGNDVISSKYTYNYGKDTTATAIWGETIFLMKDTTIDLEAGNFYGFYDSGSKNGNYTDHENYTLTVNAPVGKLAQVLFSSYDLEGGEYDYLTIYDGSSIEEEKILATLAEKDIANADLAYSATEANGGALTFRFSSDYMEEHAGWEAVLSTGNIDYDITYNLNGGTNNANNPATYTIDDNVTLADASLEGFTFAGWFAEPEFTNKVTEIALGSIGDVVLYAKFLKTYYITYNLDGGTNNANNPASYTVESETITLADASKDGYTFEGWYAEAEFTNRETEITLGSSADVVLYAKWETINYSITYNLNGGENDANNPASYNVETETIILADASREGFTFIGWYTEAEFTNKVTEITLGSIGDVVLYAKFLETYTITYNLDGGTNNAINPTSYTVESATIYFAGASKDGYTFAGWYSDAEYRNRVTEIALGSTGNVVLYARYLTTYTITYNLDGGTNDAINPASFTVESATITLADASKEGYTFEGWYSEAEFTNKVTEIALGSSVDVVLFAKWEATNYTITYNLDGGTNDANNPASYTIESETITLANASREGFTFEGWYADDEFTTDTITEITAGSTGDVVLYAKWEEVTGLDNVVVAMPFTQIENTLYFTNPTDMAVYTVSGIMLYSGNVTEYTLPNATAVYIIRTSNGSYKVMRIK